MISPSFFSFLILFIYGILLLLRGNKMAKWTSPEVVVGIFAIIVVVIIALYQFWWLPSHIPKPYVALILQTSNQTPLSDTLWVVNPNMTPASSFDFYIQSNAQMKATNLGNSIDVRYPGLNGNAGTDIYVETHNINGGDLQAINLSFSNATTPSFQVLTKDVGNCNVTLKINSNNPPIVNIHNLTQPVQFVLSLKGNSITSCNPAIVNKFLDILVLSKLHVLVTHVCNATQKGNLTTIQPCN